MILSFYRELVEPVIMGEKSTTLRKGRRFKPGMELQLWCMSPRAKAQGAYQFGTATVTETVPIALHLTKQDAQWVVSERNSGPVNMEWVWMAQEYCWAPFSVICNKIGSDFAPKNSDDFIFIGQMVRWSPVVLKK